MTPPESKSFGYDEIRQRFSWRLPSRFNLGDACADRHPASALALIEVAGDGTRKEYTFGDLAAFSNRLANGLRAMGVASGDRVAVMLPQRVETGLAHLALYKLGAIVLPLSGLFGPDAVRHRLGSGGARILITDGAHGEMAAAVGQDLGDLRIVLVDVSAAAHDYFWQIVEAGSSDFRPAETTPDTPALLIYTSGTTGPAKGALHGHRVLLGHLPGFDLSHEFFPQEGDVFWTPADWAWIGGLMDGLLPCWYHGRPIVAAAREKFDPEWALTLMSELGVRNAFLPPTALKLMRQVSVVSADVKLRSIMSGGEALGSELLAWGQERFGVTINEIYGQTEANYVVGNCAAAWDVRPGSMGRPYPGHEVTLLDPDGLPVATGELGEIAVRSPDPVLFLRYWDDAVATSAKYTSSGEWLLTGDLATRDSDGYLRFNARGDDVIISAGYRIGPAEIEACVLCHSAVSMAAVVGVPDGIRGEVVKAFVVLASGHDATPRLEREIRDLVRHRLAAYSYPRHIEFVSELPLTPTGKIRRSELRQMEADARQRALAGLR